MEVIKDGSIGPIENWSTEVTCEKQDKFDKKEHCGAILKVGMKDLILMYWEGTHFTHHYTGMKCPQCGKYNAVKHVPDSIWKKLNTAKARSKAVFDGFSESIW